MDFNPYGNFIQWCQNNFIDLFVVGWDWRRSSPEGADFFLNDFLPRFDVMCANLNPHPLTLVGHSAGGMVVKMILNSSTNTYVQRLKKAITVATPFYGYGGRVHRYFKGDADLDWTLPGTGASTYTKVISSLPGPYEYLFLDYETYQKNALAFKCDPDGYNLNAYPSLDKIDPGEIEAASGHQGRLHQIAEVRRACVDQALGLGDCQDEVALADAGSR